MNPSQGALPPSATPSAEPIGAPCAAPEDQISGIYTMAIMDSLEKRLPADALRDFLARAGETRSVEDLRDLASWTSFDQFKRLLQEASRLSDSLFHTSDVENDDDDVDASSATVVAEIMQAFDSPGAMLRAGENNPMMPMRRYEITERASNEWLMREWFIDGFAPYPEFCSFSAGLYAGMRQRSSKRNASAGVTAPVCSDCAGRKKPKERRQGSTTTCTPNCSRRVSIS